MLKFLTPFLFLLLIGCSTLNFNKKLETANVDLLNEESLMRYNTNRLDSRANTETSFIAKALVACHQKKFSKALSILENEMNQNKTAPLYWNALGTCYSLKEEFPKALFYYNLGNEALVLMKEDSAKNKAIAEATLANNIGLIHLRFNRFPEAFESFSKARNLVPSLSTPVFNTAQLYLEFNDNEKSLDLLLKLETKNPEDIDVLYSLALVYYKKNDLDKSFKSITKIKTNYLNRPDIVGLYAYNLMNKNRFLEAKEILEKRLYADEYNTRNKLLLEEVNEIIKIENKKQ